MLKDKVDRAKVFWSGRSQAVRIPKEYRFDTEEVSIRREGNTVIMEPVQPEETELQQKWDEVFAALGEPFDDDMVEAALNRPGPDDFDRLNGDLRLKD